MKVFILIPFPLEPMTLSPPGLTSLQQQLCNRRDRCAAPSPASTCHPCHPHRALPNSKTQKTKQAQAAPSHQNASLTHSSAWGGMEGGRRYRPTGTVQQVTRSHAVSCSVIICDLNSHKCLQVRSRYLARASWATQSQCINLK